MEVVKFYYHDTPHYILSNYYPHVPGKKLKSLKIKYGGLIWPTSEHLYQALKFKWDTPEETEWREHIRTASTPNIAKHLGHQFTSKKYKWQQEASDLVLKYKNLVSLRGNCSEVSPTSFRVSIMRITLKAKYDSCPDFRDALNSTKGKKLMEDTESDWGWGRGYLGMLMEELRDKELKLIS